MTTISQDIARIRKLTESLQAATAKRDQAIDDLMLRTRTEPTTDAQMATFLGVLKEASTDANAVSKALTRTKDIQQSRTFSAWIHERDEDEQLTSLKVGGKHYVTQSKDYSVVQDRDEFLAWLDEQGEEDRTALSKQVEEKGQLDALVRRLLDDAQPLPPGVGYYTKETINVRKV